MESIEPANLKPRNVWAMLSLVLALITTLGSLYLSVGMGLKACPLCFYQRTFAMATLAVLAVGIVADRSQARLLCRVSFPLAVVGWGVAAFHVYLVLAEKLECPLGLFGLGTAPLQSLIAFSLLVFVIGVGVGRAIVPLAASAVFGLALAWACIASSPPLPPPAGKPYDQPLEICRPPFNDK